jgi:hypothetical protein
MTVRDSVLLFSMMPAWGGTRPASLGSLTLPGSAQPAVAVGFEQATLLPCRPRRRPGSLPTRCWREMDSNSRSLRPRKRCTWAARPGSSRVVASSYVRIAGAERDRRSGRPFGRSPARSADFRRHLSGELDPEFGTRGLVWRRPRHAKITRLHHAVAGDHRSPSKRSSQQSPAITGRP